MSDIRLRLPESLHEAVRQLAKQDNISINQFIMLAVAEKLSALKTEDVIRQRAARGTRDKFEKAMSRVKDAPPADEDHL